MLLHTPPDQDPGELFTSGTACRTTHLLVSGTSVGVVERPVGLAGTASTTSMEPSRYAWTLR